MLLCLFISSFFVGTTSAKAPDVIDTPEVTVIIPKKATYTQDEVRVLVKFYADLYGISSVDMMRVVDEESDFLQYAKGDGGHSLGVCQIHSSNKIPDAKRYDPHWCLDWMAGKIANGQGRLWTAYRTCILGEVVRDRNGKQILCHS